MSKRDDVLARQNTVEKANLAMATAVQRTGPRGPK